MATKIDAPPLPLPLPTSTSTSPSSSLPRPLAHVVLLLIDGVGDVPCKAFAQGQQREGGSTKSSGSSISISISSKSSISKSLTPLQAAAPLGALDAVASRGLLGLLDPVQPGKACGSDTAHLSLLGYDPRTYYRGRGAFESLGAGLSMEPGDIAFKCNFATLEEEDEEEEEGEGRDGKEIAPTPLVVSRRADRAFEEAGPVLCSALDGLELPGFPGVEVRVRYATEHRAGVVLSTGKQTRAGALETPPSAPAPGGGENGDDGAGGAGRKPFELSDAVSGTDPLKDNLALRRCVPLPAKDAEEEEGEQEGGEERRSGEQGARGEEEKLTNARKTAEIVNELSDEIRKILRAHPLNLERRRQGKAVANALLLRGCGARAPLPDFAQRFGFAKACAVAPTKIIAGLALCAGFEVLECEGGTGDYRTSLSAKVDAVVGAVKRANEEQRRRGRAGEDEGAGGEARAEARPLSPSSPIFVLLHVKAVDDAGHDRAPCKKMAWLRAVDAALERLTVKLSDNLEPFEGAPGVVVAVTGDHSTPVEFGDHSCEPVPFAAAPLLAVTAAAKAKKKKTKGKKKKEAENGGGGSESDEEGEIVAPSEEEMRRVVSELATAAEEEEYGTFPSLSSPLASFDETSASRGSLGRFPGAEVMPLLVRLSAAWGGVGRAEVNEKERKDRL